LYSSRRRESVTEFLIPVPDGDVRAFDAHSAQNSLGFVEAHTVVVEHNCEFHDEGVGPLALEEDVFERFPVRDGSGGSA
jgi:hypothetical protein